MRSSKLTTCLRATALAATLAVSSLVGASSALAPAFTLPSRSGDIVSLDKLKGQVVMLNFWASWCGPCRQEMPLLDQMHKRYSALGFTMLGVNVEANTADAEKWLAQTPVTFPVLFDKENKVSKLYDVNAMPSTVFIDRKGNVRYLHRGYKPGDESEYLNQIRALLKE
ncbi:MAG TPA: TlpA disulfide reductase family protein [Povalibacter sp.]|uniref:TlpA family protein disulfide reductase n=1 Tax=Povalibacter sp. TaxID=1962978 RepID=UPI002D19E2E7|nr:TlpA disulfide reductase family protein [Povalibacter sp.]HMN45053.1 TlpA disulfide reductase family protein [Povalibacter sp.]